MKRNKKDTEKEEAKEGNQNCEKSWRPSKESVLRKRE